MSFNDIAYTYSKKFYPLYEKMLKLPYSEYPFSFSLCPILLFKRASGMFTIFDHNMPNEIWKTMFTHKTYGLAFFAYHTAIIECYPRIIWHTYHPSFSLINKNIFNEISLLYSNRSVVKEIIIRDIWYNAIANNISILKIYSNRISRSTVWQLFLASLNIYNDVIKFQQDEHDRLFLSPAPGTSWRIGMSLDRRPGRCFAELGVSDYQDGEHLRIEECTPRFAWTDKAPVGWTLDKFFPVE